MRLSKINKIKQKILQVSHKAKEGHLASSFSVLDVLYVLYKDVVNLNKENLQDPNRDYVILSKGHASLAHAAILENQGIISYEQLESFCQYDSILGGHLSKDKVPGVEASTGSLGHGIAISVGVALAAKIQKINNKVYAIMGDGESNEGTFWESMLLGSHHKLDNLYCIIDFNRSNDRALVLDPIEEKLKSFGWRVVVIDGQSHREILEAFTCKNESNRPTAIVANTIKGNGIQEMENNPAWHHRSPSDKELHKMIKELT